MRAIFKMWWMVRKTICLQNRAVFIQNSGGRQMTKKEIHTRTIFRREGVFVPRYMLSMSYKDVFFIKKTETNITESISKVKTLTASKRMITVDNCISRGFLRSYEKRNSTLVTVDLSGQLFSGFSGLIREWLIYLKPVTSFLVGGGAVGLIWIVRHIVILGWSH